MSRFFPGHNLVLLANLEAAIQKRGISSFFLKDIYYQFCILITETADILATKMKHMMRHTEKPRKLIVEIDTLYP